METNTWFTLDELATHLKLSRTNLYRIVQQSKIPASKIGFQQYGNQRLGDKPKVECRHSSTTRTGQQTAEIAEGMRHSVAIPQP
ncbi:hypothetical protein COB11_05405 [Candidatus Aerophobetes bacterium]|uniref:Helix-turn-helix domain-containing protein n=1 Tax=Aerophobetes bacterium TaxID=2030807 RepID=A0A2A4YFJ4_UNCAE|nr:MAG: hypothetical protein COB11_05405 [Candidatus Aerophobetes bacterium]